jgi:hypothetical protein
MAVIHAGRVIEAALRLQLGARVVHLVTAETPHLDSRQRRPLEQEGVPYYPSPDFWAPEI